MPRAFRIHISDSVAVLLDDAVPGLVCLLGETDNVEIIARESIPFGHKIAVRAHAKGEAVRKYGVRIGHATLPIFPGDWVHLHNCASDVDMRSNTLEVNTGTPTDTLYE